ncbi:MAG: FAD-dependent oxidoreductase, partial [Spirochaetota bacterium]
MNSRDKSLKIAIIGAGPSGLTMAHYLKKQGFDNVTIFEKNQHPGGKVLSVIEEKTGQVLELGAVWVPYAYQTVRELINEYQIELIDAPMTQLTELNPARSNQKYVRVILSNIRKSKTVQAYLKGRTEGRNFPFAKPGFEFKIEKDFTLSFSEYAKKYKIEPLGEAFIPLDTGCGYGFPEEVPALYKLKFLDLVLKDMEMQLDPKNQKEDRQTKYVKKGYQEIWKQVAKNQHIQYNAPITKIRHWKD